MPLPATQTQPAWYSVSTFFDPEGKLVKNRQLSVMVAGGNVQAAIYNRDGSPSQNPLPAGNGFVISEGQAGGADVDGNVQFGAAAGMYDLFAGVSYIGTVELVAQDSDLLHTHGDETKAGILTLSDGLKLPSGAAAGDVWTSDGSGAGSWAPPPSGSPSGTAGGDLSGSYPNPTIATGAITSAKIADGTIVDGDISASAGIQASKVGAIPIAQVTGLAGELAADEANIAANASAIAGKAPMPGVRLVTGAYTILGTDSVVLADATGQVPPTAVSATPVGSGGTFAARTAPLGYFWQVTAVGPLGESYPLNAGAGQGIVANGSAVINWVAAPGATSYKLYRSTFATNQYPPNGTMGLVASGITGTSYTDTGAATSAGTPPAANFGSAFTLTLPDATTYRGILSLRAIGNTPSLIAVTSVSGQQIGALGTTVLLGQTAAAFAQGIRLISDGANWRIVTVTPAPIWYSSGVGLNAGTITPAQGLVPVAILPVPQRLGFGQRGMVHASCQLIPATGATVIYPEIYWCTAAGAFQGYNSGAAGTMNGSQIAFWYDQAFTPGEYAVFSGHWNYNPRPGDYNIEGGGWGGYDSNLGLFIQTVGGDCQVVSSSIDMTGGAVTAQYFGAH